MDLTLDVVANVGLQCLDMPSGSLLGQIVTQTMRHRTI